MSTHSFTIPAPVLRKASIKYVLLAMAGVALSEFTRAKPSLVGLLMSIITVLAILGVGYYVTRRYVWVTLSTDGVQGKGDTGRELAIPWNEPIAVEDKSRFGFKGVAIRRTADVGFLGLKVSPLFIPQPILELESFKAALVELAPPSNPLLARVKNAI